MNATQTSPINAQTDSLEQIAQGMEAAGDFFHAHKVRQLSQKRTEEQMVMAFCGHFSAGKSSLINQLCGQRLLPSSPIPTSANIVRIRNGDKGATIVKRGDSAALTVALEQIEEYCTNGTDIESVTLSFPLPFLGSNAALLDTPGIDSTDEAHFAATESALHLADAVIYVMDYNHVLSEVNFHFAKRLAEWGKPLYLVVNQIDKHHESELTFEEYREGVSRSFAAWNISYQGIFYISLKHPEHPHNEWRMLQRLAELLVEHSPKLVELSVAKSSYALVEEHLKWYGALHAEEKDKLAEQLSEEREAMEAVARFEELKRQLEELGEAAEKLTRRLRKDWTALLDNAHIIPAASRDLAKEYLQTRKPGYKVGWFFTGGKTAAETEKRLVLFHADVTERLNANVIWHMRDLMVSVCREIGVAAQPYVRRLEQVGEQVTPQWLAAQVLHSAVISDEYTMIYCKQTMESLKGLFRKCANELSELLGEEYEKRAARERTVLQAELAELQPRLNAWRQLEDIARTERDYAEYMRSMVWKTKLDVNEAAPSRSEVLLTGAQADTEVVAMRNEAAAGIIQPKLRVQSNMEKSGIPGDQTIERRGLRLRQTAEKLRLLARELTAFPAMGTAVQSLTEKANRLESSTFTIALFGAFSAGKSSFANALLGESLLPVSPNPTTAAINQIVPASKEWPSGTAMVRMKSKESVLDDIRFSLKALGLSIAEGKEDLLPIVREALKEQHSGAGKAHYTFLQAVADGWPEAEPAFGERLKVDFASFRMFVAEERKSCFVDCIDLHHDGPITEQGIVIVDTPGADSIHARHTGVSFEYIKNADAILFVTYYNHAFSRADREFLMQLGRVKDAFELDKMFFLVNAADLAASDEELELVLTHVEKQLLQFGIRNPRIYPVSSLDALSGKQRGDEEQLAVSGFAAFEREFMRFSIGELEEVAIRSARSEWQRSISLLERWVSEARSSREQREQKAEQLQTSLSYALSACAYSVSLLEESELSKEVKELLYYVKQRIGFRFNELYQASFHPSVLSDDGRNLKAALRAAWYDLSRMVSYQLSQEILATTLRIERFLNRSARKKVQDAIIEAQAYISDFTGGDWEDLAFKTPQIADWTSAPPDEKLTAAHFRSAKQFFEGDGKSKLRDELEKRWMPLLSDYLDEQAELLEVYYRAEYEAGVQMRLNDAKSALTDHTEGMLSALHNKINLIELERKLNQLKQYEV